MSYFMAFVIAVGTLLLPQPCNAATVNAAAFTDLNQDQIVAAMGAGYNLGNTMEANINGYPDETSWGNPVVTQELIQTIKNAGFRTLRIPVSYMYLIGSAPNYTIDSSWLKRVKQVVDYAIKSGLYVIINMHADGGTSPGAWIDPTSSGQTVIKDKLQKVWTQIAACFKDYDQHLIFESMNEVGANVSGDSAITACYSNINAYNQIFVNAVRATGSNNAKRWLLIPGWYTNIDYTVGNYGFAIPTDNACTAAGKRIMISVHYYSPYEFCLQSTSTVTQWGNGADQSKCAAWGGEDYLVSQIQSVYHKFVAQGYPVVIGEYGAHDKSSFDPANADSRVRFYKRLCEVSKQYGCVPVAWDGGSNGVYEMGLFDRKALTITQPSIINAIMGVFPSEAPTVTPTVTPVITPTTAPSATPTVTPTPAPAQGKLTVQFSGTIAEKTNTISGKYKLTNTGSAAISLSEVTLRYYYTREGTANQNFYCDWSSIGSQKVSGSFHAISPAKANADYYLEISFSSEAGTLAAGQSVEVQTRFAKSDWSSYTQTNDYSYHSASQDYTDWTKVTAYISNVLVYGIECV